VGTADRRLATCLRASVAHDMVTVHPLQSNDQVVWKLFHSTLCFFVFSPFCIFLFRFYLRRFLHFC